MRIRVLAHFGIFMLLWGALASCSNPPPLVKNGVADLTRWDFSKNESAPLDGEWDFWWNQSIAESGSSPDSGRINVRVPGFWNDDDAPYPAEGLATYHLKVLLPEGNWSLYVPDVACSWHLTVNGKAWADRGVASVERRAYQAEVRPLLICLPMGQTEYDLSLTVANFSDRAGGFRDSFFIGPSPSMERKQRVVQMDSAFFAGGLLVMAIFNLAIFFLQRQKGANLWLAVFASFIAVRTVFTGPRIVHDIWLGIPFELATQVEFFCILGAVASFILYMKFLFPEWWPARIFISYLFYTGLFAVLLLVLPIKTYAAAFLGFYDLPLMALGFVFLAISWWAFHQKHEDGLLVFAGMVFLLVGMLNDVVHQFVPLPQGYMLGRFLFIFLVFNTFLLSRQLSKDFALTQKQSGELRKLDKLKDDFLARVTHELRTPIHGMSGILDAFRMGDFGPLSDRQKYHLGLLEASSRRLLAMVNSILDFGHLRKHKLVSEPQPILLRQTVDFLLPSFFPLLKPEIALVNRITDQIPAALGDEARLEQVLHHLLRNALQHTEAGTIAVEAEVRDHQILVMVRDPGRGIPTDKLNQLFSPFHQADEINTRDTGGLGLGLAISRQLVEQMGGRLELESTEHVGTTALLWLPVCPPSRLQYYQSQRIERSFPGDQGYMTKPTSLQETAPSGENASSQGPTVLIVDDEPVNLLVLRTFLVRAGFVVIEASGGQEALKKIHEQPVDLVILDIMMPGMSGFEVCLKIRERFTPARLPILLLTAKNQVEDLLQGFRCGASDFLTKPFQRDELKARMDLHLKVSKAARYGTVISEKTP